MRTAPNRVCPHRISLRCVAMPGPASSPVVRWCACCLLLIGLVLSSPACLPDPHKTQMADLLEDLVAARSMFDENPPRIDDACNVVGVVQTRLYGEPGLVDVQPAWPHLRDASNALSAVCGHHELLAQPSTGSVWMEAARQRWQQGIDREMSVACDHLRAAAAALSRAAPC